MNGLGYKEGHGNSNCQYLRRQAQAKPKINYRMRDAIFGRQRYWGEPVPVYFKDGLPYLIDEKELPLILPEVDKYLPTESGEPPLARAKGLETSTEGTHTNIRTMPGWAGSSWYWYRYMDAHNEQEFASQKRYCLLERCRPVHRRQRTCYRAFAVQPFLEQVFERHGPGA